MEKGLEWDTLHLLGQNGQKAQTAAQNKLAIIVRKRKLDTVAKKPQKRWRKFRITQFADTE
jgi:hypothetical protein